MAPRKRTQSGNASATNTATAPKSKRAKKNTNSTDSKNDEKDDVKDSHKNGASTSQSKASTENLVIPVDENCPLASSGYKVFVGEDGTIYDVSLNQTNSQNNNNKFYRIQILQSGNGKDFKTWCRWGRVGEGGQNSLSETNSFSSAESQFNKKFKEKSGLKWENRLDPPKSGKYVYIERDYEPDDEDDQKDADKTKKESGEEEVKVESEEQVIPPSELPAEVQSLLEFMFNKDYFSDTLLEMDYDAKKLPLGKLSKRTLEQGYQALKDLADIMMNKDPSRQNEISSLSDRYYSLIPHAFGRNRPPIISQTDRLMKEIALLQSLGDMCIAEEIMKSPKKNAGDIIINPLDTHFAGLKLKEMTPLKHTTKEFKELSKYLTGSVGSTHSYMKFEVQDIFRIEREGEFDRFDSSEFNKLEKKNRRLLWHGSRATNYGGILSQGLRIAPPEAPVSGYMFGKGIYLADMASKSANYCCSGVTGNTGLLLLCETELGDPMHELLNADYNAGEVAAKANKIATWGKGLVTPLKWKDGGTVHKSLKGIQMPDLSVAAGDSKVDGAYLQYNEYIVYNIQQVKLRYLLRVKM